MFEKYVKGTSDLKLFVWFEDYKNKSSEIGKMDWDLFGMTVKMLKNLF